VDKQVLYFGKSDNGVFAQALFGSAGAFEKTAGAPAFADWETGDDIRKFIRSLTREDRAKNAYVLVNALGAGEYFGSNINADYFPWDALAHEGDDFGYKTFLKAHAFQHHANKDPDRAFGVPVVSLLNPRMKRVELIIKLDREKAKQQGADGIISRIDRGEFPDVSMGCRVPFDICSVCGNKSKTRDDYCEHMRPPEELRGTYGPNKILPDGRRIYVVNLTPRFFDISFVFIGADKTAKVMAKLASKGPQVCVGPVCAVPQETGSMPLLYDGKGEPIYAREKTASACDGMRGPCGRLCDNCEQKSSCHTAKLASAFGIKTAAQSKKAEIIKNIPAGAFSVYKLPEMESKEPDIDNKTLDSLSKVPLSDALANTARLGMVLKPHEFQHVVLRRMGEDELLNKLNREHKVFRETPDIDRAAKVGDLDNRIDEVFEALKEYIKTRTSMGSPFMVRVTILGKGSKKSLPTRDSIKHPLLDKVSAAYNGYRHDLLMKIPQAVEAALGDSKSRDVILGDELANMFLKSASAPMINLDSVSYIMSAHFQNRALLSDSIVANATILDDEWFR
jgi:hypothetical protein